MKFLRDVLDETGRSPREIGAAQIWLEPVVRAIDGRARLTVWAQAALEPCPPSRFAIFARRVAGSDEGAASAGLFELGAIVGAAVVKSSRVLRLPDVCVE